LPTEIGWQRRTKTMRGTERVAFTKKLMEAAGFVKRDLTRDAYNCEVNRYNSREGKGSVATLC